MLGWGENNGQFVTRKHFLDMPKRIGVTNVKQICCGNDLLAIIDFRNDLYIVGKGKNQKVWL